MQSTSASAQRQKHYRQRKSLKKSIVSEAEKIKARKEKAVQRQQRYRKSKSLIQEELQIYEEPSFFAEDEEQSHLPELEEVFQDLQVQDEQYSESAGNPNEEEEQDIVSEQHNFPLLSPAFFTDD